MDENNWISATGERRPTDDWLEQAEWLAERYADKPRTIKSAFRQCGLPVSTGYAMIGIGRCASVCSAAERERLRRIGAAKARLIARSQAPLGQLLALAERTSAREFARLVRCAEASGGSGPEIEKGEQNHE